MYLGPIDENIGAVIYGTLYKVFGPAWLCYLGAPDCYHFDVKTTNQLIFWNLYHFFAFRFDSILMVNLLILVTFIISVVVFYKSFRTFLTSRLVSALMAGLLISSPYFQYKLFLHYDLAQFWLFLVVFLLLLKAKTHFGFVVAGVLMGCLVGVSNYLAYFGMIFLALFVVYSFIVFKILHLSGTKPQYLEPAKLALFLTSFFCVSILVMLPYVQSIRTGRTLEQETQMSRPLDDFITFSSRPWYYVLPSADNPFFGKFTVGALSNLKDTTGYYLFNNYFKSEHSAAYLGIINILIATVGVYASYKTASKDRKLISYPLALTFVSLVMLSFPPEVHLLDSKLYLPSLINFKLFPMFRVLARVGVFTLFIVLVFTGYGYESLLKKKPGYKLIIVSLWLLSLAEFYNPLTLTFTAQTPKAVAYLTTQTDTTAIIAFYPNSKYRDMLLWLPTFKRKIANPKDYVSPHKDFVSNRFTADLTTTSGLLAAKARGVTHLFVFWDDLKPQAKMFFSQNPMLTPRYQGTDLYANPKFCATRLVKCNNASNLGTIYIFSLN